MFYVYHKDTGSLDGFENFGWIKDQGLFKNAFFEIMSNFEGLALKPDGDYFLFSCHFPDEKLKLLLTNSDWSQYKKDWEETLEKYVMNGKGLFLNVDKYCTQKHRF